MLLENGNTGLLYKESASTDAPRILFQELAVTGRKVRRPLEISDATSLPKVNTLDTGNLLFPWFDMQAGLWGAQVIDRTGEAKSNPFLLTENAGDFGNAGTVGRSTVGFWAIWSAQRWAVLPECSRGRCFAVQRPLALCKTAAIKATG